uniref:Uncharacterized protein n=1 Tax=Solibacter usitatus (strain Ellin6076) TaxID=234267 RepID=Q022H1_SOLUE
MTEDQIRKLKFDGWPLPDDYLTELGRISSLWGLLDSFLEMCLGKLAGYNDVNDPAPFILLAHTNFPQRLDMLGALCEHLAPMYPELAGYPQVRSSIKAAQKLRNKFVHNNMGIDESKSEVRMGLGSARGTLKFSSEAVKLTDLRKTSMTIHQAHCDLYALVLKRKMPPIWERPDGLSKIANSEQ